VDHADRDREPVAPKALAPEGMSGRRTGTLLLIDDEVALRTALAAELTREGYRVLECGTAGDAYDELGREVIHVALLDLRLGSESGLDILKAIRADWPDTAVIMLTAHGQVETAVEAIKLGAFDFFPKPFELERLLVSVQNALVGSALKEEVRFLRRRQRPRSAETPIVGKSPAMAEVEALVRAVATTRSTVLLLGETGSGKEVIARAIHWASGVAEGPFVDVNCASIPNELLESELFGHERGSFTSADRQKKGLFEMAHGGSLFLDEIGEMSLGLQAKLLRVLEQRRFRRVGGIQDIQVDVRVIAATNRDLSARMRDGRFRDDLFYRLAVLEIRIPPLRERREDLDSLIEALLAGVAGDLGHEPPRIANEALDLLRSYDWPGNVRELRNVLERAFLIGGTPIIFPEHLPAEIRGGGAGRGASAADRSFATTAPATTASATTASATTASATTASASPAERRPAGVLTLDEAERAAIEAALLATGGNKTLAARKLGISRQTLRTKIHKYRIEGASREPETVEA
jgi:two-component system, NtrC family, response regulator AtoC